MNQILFAVSVLLSITASCKVQGTISASSLQDDAASPANTTTILAEQNNQLNANRQRAQLAPYALERDGQTSISLTVKMTSNVSSSSESPGQLENVISAEVGASDHPTENSDNATDYRAGGSLKNLLEALNNSKEVKFDNGTSDPGSVSITISNMRDLDEAGHVESLPLEELLEDAKLDRQDVINLTNSVLKDNHRYMNQKPIRVKPASSIGVNTITIPPLRRTIDVVAENYTINKIVDEANIFALKLLHQSNVEKLGSHNIVNTPFAVYQGLSLLLSGAMGDTSRELDRVLLGSQSAYENTKLTHDQDRARLLNSFGDTVRQLHQSSTNHWSATFCNATGCAGSGDSPYYGGTSKQHLVVANSLLFSPTAYEISTDFKNTLQNHYPTTALAKAEVGSTETIQVVNSWIRKATVGLIPTVFNKKSTFDEYNVMTLLSTSWLAQEWSDTFYKVASPLRSNIRLKGQNSLASYHLLNHGQAEALMEFVDDNRQSHFVEFIRSRPTKNIHHYHSILNGQEVDIVTVPFQDSNHRLVIVTPITAPSVAIANLTRQSSETSAGHAASAIDGHLTANETESSGPSITQAPDSSALSKLISSLASNPRRAMRSLWNTIHPDIITKHTLQTIQRVANRTREDARHILVTSIPPKVQLSIPIMKIEADSSISASLNHIGIVNSFDPAHANFIGINGHPFNYNKLHLSNVVTKTTFNLDERGINYHRTIKTLEALRVFPDRKIVEGSDNDKMSDTSRYELVDEVKLDKPFAFMVCDFRTKLVLYSGTLRNPSQSDD